MTDQSDNSNLLVRLIDELNEWTGRGLAWLTLIMVLTMFSIVVFRYAFEWGDIAYQESVSYMHAMVLMLGSAYTLKHAGHVRVDIFYGRMRPQAQGWIDSIGILLLLLPTCAFVLWISWDYVASSWALKETSREAGGLPYVYLLKALIPLAFGLLVLQSLSELVRSVSKIRA